MHDVLFFEHRIDVTREIIRELDLSSMLVGLSTEPNFRSHVVKKLSLDLKRRILSFKTFLRHEKSLSKTY